MPIMTPNLSALPEASCERLKSGLDMAAEAVVGASESLEALRDTNNFPQKKEAAINALQHMVDAFVGLPGLLHEAGVTIRDASFEVLEGFPTEDHPIVKDTVLGMDTCSIACDSLHHPRYLDPYLFGKAVRENHASIPFDGVTMESISRANPEDMYCKTILTRTYLYMVGLREADEEEWFYQAAGALEEVGTECTEYYTTALHLVEAVRAGQFNELAIKTIDNPSFEANYLKFVGEMLGAIKVLNNGLKLMHTYVTFFQEYAKLLVDTHDAVSKAYACYVEATAPTF